MKVLVIGLTDNIGGVETFFDAYYDILHADIKFDFLTICEKIAFEDKYIRNGSKIYKVTNFIKNPISYYRQTKAIIKDNRYDVIHINMLSAANILPIIAAKRCHVGKIITHSHNSSLPKGIIRKMAHYANILILRKMRTVKVACGNISGKWMFGRKSEFMIINNAIDAEKFKFDDGYRRVIREKNHIDITDIVLGNVGRLEQQKNQIFLINILKNIPNTKLMIIGSGSKYKEIVNKAKSEGVEDRLIIIDNTPDVYKYYSAFDIFVFPSLFEGMPIAPIEAQANGLITILSSTITQEANQGKAIYIELDEKKWIKAINNIIINKEHRDRKKALKPDYDIAIKSKDLKNIYKH